MSTTFSTLLESHARLLVPLFSVGHIYLIDTIEKWKILAESVGDTAKVLGSSGRASIVENDITGEVVFLLGVFNSEVSTLAHEAAHITFYILQTVGEDVSVEGNNETFCYLLQNIIEWGMEQIDFTPNAPLLV